MSGPPREPKSKQSGGDLKISLTPAGLFVVAMIVFFFAGGIFAYAYAGKQGSDEQNLQISKERATNLMKILQNQGHVTNTIRAVGMGGLDFFDKNDAEKNRIAEIWLVAP